jgi:hypothetical protein
MKTLAELKEELAIHQQNLTSDLIKNTDDLRESLEQKIEEMITKIENYSDDEEPAPVVEAEPEFEPVVKKKKVVEEKPIVEKAPKTKAEPKVKEEKPKSERRPTKTDSKGNVESVLGFSVGEKAKFIDKETGKANSGVIVKFELCHGKTDEYNAYLMVGNEKKKMRAHKLIK